MVLEGQQYPLYDAHSADREHFSHQEHQESLLKKDEQQSNESDIQEHKIKEDFIQAAYEIGGGAQIKKDLSTLQKEILLYQGPREVSLDAQIGVIHLPYDRKGKTYDFYIQAFHPKTVQIVLFVNGSLQETTDIQKKDFSQDRFFSTISGMIMPLIPQQDTFPYETKMAQAYLYVETYQHMKEYDIRVDTDKKIMQTTFAFSSPQETIHKEFVTIHQGENGKYILDIQEETLVNSIRVEKDENDAQYTSNTFPAALAMLQSDLIDRTGVSGPEKKDMQKKLSVMMAVAQTRE